MSPAGRQTVLDVHSVPNMVANSSLRAAHQQNHYLMTYQSLSAELEQEKSGLEDMHMFFVAFYRRQRNIIENADDPGRQETQLLQVQLGSQSVTDKVKQEREQKGTTGEMNVDILEQEITLEN